MAGHFSYNTKSYGLKLQVIITSLCKDLSQSVAELSVKLAYLSDVEALSDVTLECRKNLLDCATALTAALAKARSDCVVVGSEQKYVVAQVVFPLLSKGCLQVTMAHMHIKQNKYDSIFSELRHST